MECSMKNDEREDARNFGGIEAYQDEKRTVNALSGMSERITLEVKEKDTADEENGTECSAENDAREDQRDFEETSVTTKEFIYDHRTENTREEEEMMTEALLPLESRVAEATAEEEDYFCDYYADYKEMASLEEGQPVEVTASERVTSNIRMESRELPEEETLLDEEQEAEREEGSEKGKEDGGNGGTEESFPCKTERGSLKPEVIRALEERFESDVSAVRVLFQWPPYKPTGKREVVHVQFMNSGGKGTENASKDEDSRREEATGEQERPLPDPGEGDNGIRIKEETISSEDADRLVEVSLLKEENAVGGTVGTFPESEDPSNGRSVAPAAIEPEPPPEETPAKGRPSARLFTTEELDALEDGTESPIDEEKEGEGGHPVFSAAGHLRNRVETCRNASFELRRSD